MRKENKAAVKPVKEFAELLGRWGFRLAMSGVVGEVSDSYEFMLPCRPVVPENWEGSDLSQVEAETRGLWVYGPAIFPGSDIGQQPNGYYLCFCDENTEDVVSQGVTLADLEKDLAKYVPQVLAEILSEYKEIVGKGGAR